MKGGLRQGDHHVVSGVEMALMPVSSLATH